MKQSFAQEITITDELLSYSDSVVAKQYVTGEKSEKIELFLDLVESIISEGDKVCVFSKFRSLQDILIAHLQKRFKNIEVAQVHGGLNSEQRYKQVQEFSNNSKCNILLASGAANEGLNLSTAKYMIEMEPADSYLVQTQRHGRIERASSIHDTAFVYQLIANNSYDEIALKIVNKKEKYHNEIIKK